jgi:hypothetical protein
MTVLVCLAALMMVSGSWLRTIVLAQRHVRADADRLQAEFLAESGLERAAAQLALDANYQGETWTLDRQTLNQRGGAAVTIRVAAVADQPRSRRVTVEAVFPADEARNTRISSATTIQLTAPGARP